MQRAHVNQTSQLQLTWLTAAANLLCPSPQCKAQQQDAHQQHPRQPVCGQYCKATMPQQSTKPNRQSQDIHHPGSAALHTSDHAMAQLLPICRLTSDRPAPPCPALHSQLLCSAVCVLLSTARVAPAPPARLLPLACLSARCGRGRSARGTNAPAHPEHCQPAGTGQQQQQQHTCSWFTLLVIIAASVPSAGMHNTKHTPKQFKQEAMLPTRGVIASNKHGCSPCMCR